MTMADAMVPQPMNPIVTGIVVVDIDVVVVVSVDVFVVLSS